MRVERGGFDAVDLAAAMHDLDSPAVGEKLRAGVDGARHEDFDGVVLGVVRAAHVAKAASDAAGAIVREPAASPAELLGALLEQSVVAVVAAGRNLGDRDELFDLIVEPRPIVAPQVLELSRVLPLVQDGAGDALAQVDIVHRRATERAPLDDRAASILGALRAVGVQKLGEHVLFALVHHRRRHKPAGLQNHHFQARFGRHRGGSRAACARADDAKVRLDAHGQIEVRRVVDHWTPSGVWPGLAMSRAYLPARSLPTTGGGAGRSSSGPS